ncbi:endonuclease/exonuclease/phosphatase family protein [Reichenbachiella sp.]|uniref:endonuclease/exonuclease/phosphatase family protein n=1 Tax=Reichenbachiella sp. TaxID=2184521 RepID=UPI0032999DE8
MITLEITMCIAKRIGLTGHRVTWFILLLIMASHASAQNMGIMSFNIRYNNPQDGINSWDNRKGELVNLVNYYHPDILGLQEGLQDQIKYMDESMSDYAMIGVGREDGKLKGEYAAIFYDSTKYKLISQNTFWLSDSPEEVSVGWDAALERICTYGLFADNKSKQEFYIFNTHFDHVGLNAQKKSAELITKKIDELTTDDSVIILMGDLNCEPASQPILTLEEKLEDGMKISNKGLYGPSGTFNGFDTTLSISQRIDYIFTRNLEVISYRHIDDLRKNKEFVSDHLPVFIQSNLAVKLQ